MNLIRVNRVMLRVALGLMLLAACFSTPADAAGKKTPAAASGQVSALKSDSPLHIASDRMESSQTDRTILFEGHVVVQQDDLNITGKRLKVFPAASAKPASENNPAMMDKIDRIEVEGDVRITQREKAAASDKAVYYHQERKVVLIGNPRVSQGPDSVQGRVITLYIADGRSVVEGGDEGPVHAVLHPKKE